MKTKIEMLGTVSVDEIPPPNQFQPNPIYDKLVSVALQLEEGEAARCRINNRSILRTARERFKKKLPNIRFELTTRKEDDGLYLYFYRVKPQTRI